jgi:16S rRNA (uracil1498-N3)-methyltransferase
MYLACVEAIEKNKTRLLILETKMKQEPRVHITLGQALLKSKGMDLVIQKATELGTHAIAPLTSQRTVVKIDDKQGQKLKRWERIAVEASKQCGRSTIPKIHPMMGLDIFVAEKKEDKKLFLNERGGKPLRDMLLCPLIEKKDIPGSIILLVGPEGGWTEREEQDIMDYQYEPVSIGPLTVRSETAAIVSLAMISHFWKKEDVS